MEPGTPEINPTQPETKPKKPAIAGKLIKALGVGIVGGTMVIAGRGAEAKHSPDVGKLPESPVTLVAGSEVSEAASPLETVFAVNDGPKFLDTAALNAAHAENPEDPAIIAIDKALFECAQNQDFGDPSHPIQPSIIVYRDPTGKDGAYLFGINRYGNTSLITTLTQNDAGEIIYEVNPQPLIAIDYKEWYAGPKKILSQSESGGVDITSAYDPNTIIESRIYPSASLHPFILDGQNGHHLETGEDGNIIIRNDTGSVVEVADEFNINRVDSPEFSGNPISPDGLTMDRNGTLFKFDRADWEWKQLEKIESIEQVEELLPPNERQRLIDILKLNQFQGTKLELEMTFDESFQNNRSWKAAWKAGDRIVATWSEKTGFLAHFNVVNGTGDDLEGDKYFSQEYLNSAFGKGSEPFVVQGHEILPGTLASPHQETYPGVLTGNPNVDAVDFFSSMLMSVPDGVRSGQNKHYLAFPDQTGQIVILSLQMWNEHSHLVARGFDLDGKVIIEDTHPLSEPGEDYDHRDYGFLNGDEQILSDLQPRVALIGIRRPPEQNEVKPGDKVGTMGIDGHFIHAIMVITKPTFSPDGKIVDTQYINVTVEQLLDGRVSEYLEAHPEASLRCDTDEFLIAGFNHPAGRDKLAKRTAYLASLERHGLADVDPLVDINDWANAGSK